MSPIVLGREAEDAIGHVKSLTRYNRLELQIFDAEVRVIILLSKRLQISGIDRKETDVILEFESFKVC